MDFTKVNIETSPEDMDEEALRGALTEFMDAQDANIAAFTELAEEAGEDLEKVISDFSEFRDNLIEEAAEAGPLNEDELRAVSFERLTELHAEFAVAPEADESPEEAEAEEAEATFADMGSRGETHTDEEAPEFARNLVAGIPGVVLTEDN